MGARAALLVGLAYEDEPRLRLRGTHGDVRAVWRWLVEDLGWAPGAVCVCTDEARGRYPGSRWLPWGGSRALEGALRALVASPTAFFYYAGHGVQGGTNVLEADGLDEMLLLPGGEGLLDDALHAALTSGRPGSRALAVFDACASATLCDLPYGAAPDSCGVWRGAPEGERAAPPLDAPQLLCISAARDGGSAQERNGRGLFTRALLDALPRGGAPKKLGPLMARVQRKLSGVQESAVSSSHPLGPSTLLGPGGFLVGGALAESAFPPPAPLLCALRRGAPLALLGACLALCLLSGS
jgi:hypothetical protein